MKLSNVKRHWKTTVMGIVGGLLMIAGLMWPDQINPETGESINVAIDEIVTGIGALIPIIAALFAKDD
jgi:hypothetical protein